jgi:hypothetical protein
MQHCEDMPIEDNLLKADDWPRRIHVTQALLDAAVPNGPVRFGTRGTLRFFVRNGDSVYQKEEDRPGGWIYRLVESRLEHGHAA